MTSAGSARRQRGVAIITVLFVVALAAALAYGLAARQMASIRLADRLIEYDQALAYALGAEAYARELLLLDLEGGQALQPGGAQGQTPGTLVDGLSDVWATPFQPLAIDGGFTEVRIRDLQGCFNLNSLTQPAPQAGEAGEAGETARTDDAATAEAPAAPTASRGDLLEETAPERTPHATLKRLLANLSLEEGLADVFRDWIDDDADVQGFGAEDGAYLLADEPFRVANAAYRSLSEVALAENLALEDMAVLAPHVCVLPVPELAVNVNTASAEVLGSLAANFGPPRAEAIARPEEPWQTVQEFTSEDPDGGLAAVASHLSVSSAFFEITVEARYGRAAVTLTSRVHRDEEARRTTVIDRDLGRDLPPPWAINGSRT